MIVITICCSNNKLGKSGNCPYSSIKTRSPEVAQHKAAAGSGPQQEQIIAMTDTSHAAVMGLSGTAGLTLFLLLRGLSPPAPCSVGRTAPP